ncbi:sulfide/dihydroorotate dehydrogenase-like FAD/NAD-binding protein [Oceanirhabdus sp. W0125-5]|uniref:sulfide/dihydroorotate dehydrogenase-like FAD/NAD-binding protein n=1 Tax=Oceanirhabdus sp. W0125-5 TaxID=2999116 RepID=UPI0022F31DA8|nr:sulfide/dihydroorotate dehydrogenase-like FAD/NAD-binding protein [Oceanirhabdus sp. W0125-5]WBW98563.1 sulfide/dihydroorotate dehydrogenase-like FAD/NAD-binding protein [Oceanirhabdus sp. W0125-5]
MYLIKRKQDLNENTFKMDILAERLAKSAQPGQFVIVKLHEKGERIPLTIADYDREEGTVSIVVQAVGGSTQRMKSMNEGDYLMDIAGPLGKPSDFVEDFEEIKDKNVLFVAGGVGSAPVYPQVKWLHENGVNADVIIGGRSAELVILKEEMSKVANEVYIATDDGSLGMKGRVTDMINHLVNVEGKKYDLVIAIGPLIMMKFVALQTKELGIPTVVSMNPIMVDGTGMCGACRVTVGGKIMFACVDGPEFDGHLVDFDEAMRRATTYKEKEKLHQFKAEECQCHRG